MYEPGIYVVKLPDGRLDLREHDEGWWLDFGNPRDQTTPGGTIIAGPFTPEQIAALGAATTLESADTVVCPRCRGAGFVWVDKGPEERVELHEQACPTCQQRGRIPRSDLPKPETQ